MLRTDPLSVYLFMISLAAAAVPLEAHEVDLVSDWVGERWPRWFA